MSFSLESPFMQFWVMYYLEIQGTSVTIQGLFKALCKFKGFFQHCTNAGHMLETDQQEDQSPNDVCQLSHP